MPTITQLADLTATYNGDGVDVVGPGTASLSLDLSGNVSISTAPPDDPVYQRMVDYGQRVLSRNTL